MKLYKLSKLAIGDLEELAKFSEDIFGDEQTELYMFELQQKFDLVSEFPLMGKARWELPLEIRCYVFKSHCIFYKVGAVGVMIVRVLHVAQDAAQEIGSYNPE